MTTTIATIKPRNVAMGMSETEWAEAIRKYPSKVIGQNSKLKKTQFFQWTLPALTAAVVVNDKVTVKSTCPMAGDCAKVCYACQGGYGFKPAMIAHTRNMQAFLDNPDQLASDIITSIESKRKLRAFRIHDSGDFFSLSYTLWWIGIMEALPNVQFYAYTKRVAMFKRLASKGMLPKNFTVIYSYGGTEDHLIQPECDRHSRVFPTVEAMKAAGYADTTKTDEKASRPEYLKIGLVYHGTMGVERAMSDADMGQSL